MGRSKVPAIAVAVLAVTLFVQGSSSVASSEFVATDHGEPGLGDLDARHGALRPTAQQTAIVDALGARASWSRFGTPRSLFRYDGYLATGIAASGPVEAARSWIDRNAGLLLVSSADLELLRRSRLSDTDAYVLLFQQRFGGLRAAEGGLMTVGVKGSAAQGWSVAYASANVTGDARLSGEPTLSPQQAWAIAASDVGFAAGPSAVVAAKRDGEWTVMAVDGLAQPQRARLVAVPTPSEGVRVAYETLFLDERRGDWGAYQHFVDARTGRVLVRKNLVDHLEAAPEVLQGTLPAADGACTATDGRWTVGSDERIRSVVAFVEASVASNDVVVELLRDGAVVATRDTLYSPEVLVYEPSDAGVGTYEVRVCDRAGGHGWASPRTFSAQVQLTPGVQSVAPYPPKWKVFPANPELGGETYPWNVPSTDTREIWCWESEVGTPPTPIPECDREVGNLASRAPWDFDVLANAPTFTTVGNNANSAEAWYSPFTPSSPYRPVSPEREYIYDWNNEWFENECSQSSFEPGVSPDLPAAVTNLFVMHNRMHDWSYFLGFDERHWNAQEVNFGTGGTEEGDPLQGDVQAGAVDGGPPSYTGRDNANMITLPDGVPSITNMYLWQPIAGAFYTACVDGDYDMAVIGHEYTHMIENRMIGKGNRRFGHHAGAMGESHSDLLAVEYLNEYGFVPVSGESPFSVGPYVTSNHQRGVRNYGMNFPRTGAFPEPGVSPRVNPLNFSDMGYDLVGQQVHANGEIWSATNFDIRQQLIQKYNAEFPASDTALQTRCADGVLPADRCPGNRRWVQLVFDAFLLMPTEPSMLDARDAYLAADLMRFGGANQDELWLAFARRGFGQDAFSTNDSEEAEPSEPETRHEFEADPTPDFSSPRHANATVTFNAVDETGAPVTAKIFVGHYEARVSPIADTDPATTVPRAAAPTQGANRDAVASFVPGPYEFVAQANGYGMVRFSVNLAAGQSRDVLVRMPTNWGSKFKGATATGDGERFEDLIDDTEFTNWERTGASPDVRGSQITVDLAGTDPRTIAAVQVSAALRPVRTLTGLSSQNRWSALRQFAIEACTASAANASCTADGAFTRVYTSAPDAFPGFNPRPVAPEWILRTFPLASPVTATHLRIVVLENQCTGDRDFQGEQDADPLNPTDCTQITVPSVLTDRDDEVRIAELQAFSELGGVVPPRCPGRLTGRAGNHVAGTNGDDVLEGTDGPDVICGLGGKDEIRGLGGDDLIVGGARRDNIRGGAGSDVLKGSGHADSIGGGAGSDRIVGGGRNDDLRGGPGRDVVFGGPQGDNVRGDKGNDDLRGGGGDDVLRGGPGRDRCSGGGGSNQLRRCEG